MKTEREIHEMIDKMMDAARDMPRWHIGREPLLTSIDTLLWVIGDRSGAPIDPDVRDY